MLYWFDTQESWLRRKRSNIQQLVNPAFKWHATFLGQFKNHSNETKNFNGISEFETAGQLRTQVINHLQRKVDLERDVSTQDTSLQASAALTIQAHVGSLFKVIFNTKDWKTLCGFKKTCHSNYRDIWVTEWQWWFDFTTKSKSFNRSTNATPANMMHFWWLLYTCMHTATPFSYFAVELYLSTYLNHKKSSILATAQRKKSCKGVGKPHNVYIYLFLVTMLLIMTLSF